MTILRENIRTFSFRLEISIKNGEFLNVSGGNQLSGKLWNGGKKWEKRDIFSNDSHCYRFAAQVIDFDLTLLRTLWISCLKELIITWYVRAYYWVHKTNTRANSIPISSSNTSKNPYRMPFKIVSTQFSFPILFFIMLKKCNCEFNIRKTHSFHILIENSFRHCVFTMNAFRTYATEVFWKSFSSSASQWLQ